MKRIPGSEGDSLSGITTKHCAVWSVCFMLSGIEPGLQLCACWALCTLSESFAPVHFLFALGSLFVGQIDLKL